MSTAKERREVYHTKNWIMLRDQVMREQGYCCHHCKQKAGITVGAVEVHHVIPIRQRPDLAFARDNCVALCKRCHENEHLKFPETPAKRKWQELVESF